jgi:hypothetical protein
MNNNRNYHHKNSRSNAQKLSFYRVGQIFSITYQLSLLVLIYLLVTKGQQEMALKVFVINAGIVILSLVFSSIERVIYNASKRSKQNYRRRNSDHSGSRNDTRDSRDIS